MLGDTRQSFTHFGEVDFASPGWWHMELCDEGGYKNP
jgi:hypothetical protein